MNYKRITCFVTAHTTRDAIETLKEEFGIVTANRIKARDQATPLPFETWRWIF